MRINVNNEQMRMLAVKAIVGRELPFTIVFEGEKRSNAQNRLIWKLNEFASELLTEFGTHTPEVWHEFFKNKFLPRVANEDTLAGYQGVAEFTKGETVFCGSTSQLTVRGCADYCDKVMAFFAENGVNLPPKELLDLKNSLAKNKNTV